MNIEDFIRLRVVPVDTLPPGVIMVLLGPLEIDVRGKRIGEGDTVEFLFTAEQRIEGVIIDSTQIVNSGKAD